jgi:hypothetical protein
MSWHASAHNPGRRLKVRVERVLLGGLMSAVAFLLDRRLRKLQR